jgi:hypothetical protein
MDKTANFQTSGLREEGEDFLVYADERRTLGMSRQPPIERGGRS